MEWCGISRCDHHVSAIAPAKNAKQNKKFGLQLAEWNPRFVGGFLCVSLRIESLLKTDKVLEISENCSPLYFIGKSEKKTLFQIKN